MNSNTEQLIPPREGGSDVETQPTGKGGTNVYKTWYSNVRMSLQAIKLTPPHTRGRIWDLHLIMYKKWLNSAFLSKNSRRVKYRFPLPTVFTSKKSTYQFENYGYLVHVNHCSVFASTWISGDKTMLFSARSAKWGKSYYSYINEIRFLQPIRKGSYEGVWGRKTESLY